MLIALLTNHSGHDWGLRLSGLGMEAMTQAKEVLYIIGVGWGGVRRCCQMISRLLCAGQGAQPIVRVRDKGMCMVAGRSLLLHQKQLGKCVLR